MLRSTDARMSGTSYGACILHAAPESAGGPAFVKTGDLITADAGPQHPPEYQRRRASPLAALPGRRPPKRYERGYGWMYSKHIP